VSLAERLRERIQREGPISFRDFMAAALYDPQEGYYATGARIGERGDFVTSPTISPLFAATLARRFAADVEKLEGPVDFVDAGAGSGQFLEDLAAALARDHPDVAARVRLTAVERSAAARQALADRRIEPEPRILASVEDLARETVSGWVFSNELYDALPVVRVVCGAEGLDEMRVAWDSEAFVWSRAPAPDAFREHLESFGVTLAPGQIAEISFGAAPLHRTLARSLARGSLYAFDYGHRAPVLYHPAARRAGTLVVHFGGLRRGDPLRHPGHVDLTAHVNWDLLIRAGEEEGLTGSRVVRQGKFLLELGIFDLVTTSQDKWKAYRLVDPEGMGEELSVLVQTKPARDDSGGENG
jgi:SAM-dependent MidA family methyltransferase